MITEEIFYGVKCNRCLCQYEDGSHSFWSDKGTAIENAIESNWIKKDGKHYCPDCYTSDGENDIPKEEYPKYVKVIREFLVKIIRGYDLQILDNEDCIFITFWMVGSKLEECDEAYIRDRFKEELISIQVVSNDEKSPKYLHIKLKK